MAFSESVKWAVKQRAHFRRCICQRSGVSIEVHHILPAEHGGPDTEDNAAPLCPTCHEEYGANPSKRKANREQRDFWYGICEKQYSYELGPFDRPAGLVERL